MWFKWDEGNENLLICFIIDVWKVFEIRLKCYMIRDGFDVGYCLVDC